jgi:hypothetical protein
MCIISGPVLSVKSTKIFCLPSKNGKRQLTIYRNDVDTSEMNMMCLPVPNVDTVKFENVSKHIFKQCKDSFDIMEPRGYLGGAMWGARSAAAKLEVQSHGSYDVVVVPTTRMEDFDRVPDEFNILSQDVKVFLQKNYSDSYGILLCKLKPGLVEYEPFAYSHEILGNHLFYPTKHFHVSEQYGRWRKEYSNLTIEDNHEKADWDPSGRITRRGSPISIHADWDHELFSLLTDASTHESRKKVMKERNEIDWSDMPKEYQYSPRQQLRCKEIVGREYPNVDVEMKLEDRIFWHANRVKEILGY